MTFISHGQDASRYSGYVRVRTYVEAIEVIPENLWTGIGIGRTPYFLSLEQVHNGYLSAMLETGVIRRIGAVPNHYSLGFRGNGMSVWDVPDAKIREYGRRIGNLDFVSHAYHRPRRLPEWHYNLFAMVHGRDRNEVLTKVARIAELLGEDNHGHEVLFSTRILKKTGLRI